jgi:predicted nuclease of restriction endonuclease-like (RecB) superfamily
MNNPPDYSQLLGDIKQRIRSAQYEALKAVNKELIELYWDIGRIICDRQQTAGWGKSIVEQLAKDIQAEFPGISGFSVRNVWNMRSFYSSYSQNEKLQPRAAEIGWTHNLAIKDEYTFDFLELADEFNERQLEQAILKRVEPFLKEMGGMFTFVGSQYRLTVSDQEYFIDLLLYHRRLQCLVAVELKVGPFLPEYVGKMQFYLAVLNDTVRLPDENPAIGIILCKSKDRTIVEYALRKSNKPIGIATYQMVSTIPQALKDRLPAPEQVAKLLEGME